MAPDTRIYDSESDDECEEGDITLGFEDGPIASTSAVTLDAQVSRLGGQPSFWPCSGSTPASVTCGACSRASALVCQLYIPQERVEDRHRALYIFSCLQKACQRAEGCRYDPELAAETERARSVAEKEAEVKRGLPDNPFATKTFSPHFSSADNPFATSIDIIEVKKVPEAPPTEQFAALSIDKQDRAPETWPDEHPVLPAYYITTSYEGPGSSTASQSLNVSMKSAESGDAEWKNETYEATAVQDRVFLAFQARIARDNGEGQVVRVGAVPLLFSPQPIEPDVMQCLSCGHERDFEAQVMPHTVDLLESGLDEARGQELGWSVAFIWTCPSVACADKTGKGSSWIEEGVRLQFE